MKKSASNYDKLNSYALNYDIKTKKWLSDRTVNKMFPSLNPLIGIVRKITRQKLARASITPDFLRQTYPTMKSDGVRAL